MKKLITILIISLLIFCSGCANSTQNYDIVATTLPVYDFTSVLCKSTPLTVGQLVTENVSCLHDYTLQVSQMRMIESAEVVVISGAGLEDFLDDVLCTASYLIDSSEGIEVHNCESSHDEKQHGHHHEQDPHIWLSPLNALEMIGNIYTGLEQKYPQYSDIFRKNYLYLLEQLQQLQIYGEEELSELSCRNLITFHDGFAYFAESFDLNILKAIEEESGSEASAAEIIELITLVDSHGLPAVFTETNGSNACAGIINAETGVKIYNLDMAMSGDSYFDAMYHNIDTIKEALS